MGGNMNIKQVVLIIVLGLIMSLMGCQKNNEAQAIANQIIIANQNEISESFALPKIMNGNPDGYVTWESSLPELITISEYPLWNTAFSKDEYYQAVVILPTIDTTVSLTATVIYGNQLASKVFKVTVLANQYEVLSIALAKEATPNQSVEVSGTVVVSLDHCYVIQDDTGTLYSDDQSHTYVVGDIVRLRGKKINYNQMPQINVEMSEKIGQELFGFDPFVGLDTLSIEQLMDSDPTQLDWYGSLVYLSGVVASSDDPMYPYRLVHPVDPTQFIRISRDSDETGKIELQASVGEYINGVVLVYGYDAGAYYVLYIPETVIQEDYAYTTEDYLAIAAQSLQQQYSGLVVQGDQILDEEMGLAGHEATLTWVSQEPSVISHDGKVTYSDETTIVFFEVTLTIEDEAALVTVEVIIPECPLSTIASLIPLTPAQSTDLLPLVGIEGVVIGHEYKGYWVADETGALLIGLNEVITVGINAPAIGTVVHLKGRLTPCKEATSFTIQLLPIGTYTVLNKPAPVVLRPIDETFDTLFALNVTSYQDAKMAGLQYYGKQMTLCGTIVQINSDHVWKIQDPANPNQWVQLNNLGSNVFLKANENQMVSITMMIRNIYYVDDQSVYDYYRMGTVGGVYLCDSDISLLE